MSGEVLGEVVVLSLLYRCIGAVCQVFLIMPGHEAFGQLQIQHSQSFHVELGVPCGGPFLWIGFSQLDGGKR